MKCPICGQQLRPGKKDPNYLLCYNCKKKYKAPQSDAVKRTEKASQSSAPRKKAKPARVKDYEEEEEKRYSNVPPKKVRDKREEEMRRAYDEMLSVGDGKSKKKKSSRNAKANTKKRQRDYEDEYYDDYEDDYYDDDGGVSKAPIIILGIAIVVVLAVIAYFLFFK